VLGGATPTLTIGDAGAEDAKIIFDGNAQDYHIGLDDSADTLVIGKGSALGTTTSMSFDANGIITKPLQPSFLVNPSSNQNDLAIGASTNVTIVYGNERYDVGSNFASNTFTAPVTGRYMLFSQIFLLNVDKAQTYIQHYLKTSNVTYSNVVSNNQMFAADIAYMTLNQSVVTDMDASDTAFVQINMYGGTQQMDIRTDSFFGGMLIG